MNDAEARRAWSTGSLGRLAVVAALLLTACSAPIRPVVAPQDAGGHVPVIFLPGITGSELDDTAAKRTVWGNARSFFLPRDDGYAIAHPIGTTDDVIEAGRPILDVRIATWRKDVYGPLLRFMQSHGYRLGDLRHPDPRADFFFFAYDWRLGSAVNARTLSDDLERLRTARGVATLTVHLVAQSGAAHIARFFVKYGGGTLDDARSGRARSSGTVRVAKLVLVGTSNGGSIRILRDLNRGRRYVRWIGRFFSPEVLFTFPSLYDDLPVSTDELFVDPSGATVAVDLFDAEAWRTHEWSIFAPDARERAASRPELFGPDDRARLEFLRRRLADARDLHALVDRDVPWFGDTRYYSIQNAYDPTPARAVLDRSANGWETLFAGDAEVDRDPWLRSLAVAPGDGHATLDSQAWLSPQERAAMARRPALVEGGHFEIVLSPAAHRRILEFLED